MKYQNFVMMHLYTCRKSHTVNCRKPCTVEPLVKATPDIGTPPLVICKAHHINFAWGGGGGGGGGRNLGMKKEISSSAELKFKCK